MSKIYCFILMEIILDEEFKEVKQLNKTINRKYNLKRR
ncbi:hypothetical protein MPTP_1514 [Melissococcus plutonius ATCC 35311]|uniref:Uncharacterized protein n=1 Tax=Melissococcus plutonius (strain ATCC 35311 / DSM 29964 / CIP 104052 / LMG 20360 / NCIMB 702443) TaxID=940190 RepID=F3YBR5_MELPT|nr:hypothetical protein MPTP_1514 [Melissococcus plutonius ATCC 35311]